MNIILIKRRFTARRYAFKKSASRLNRHDNSAYFVFDTICAKNIYYSKQRLILLQKNKKTDIII
jgi:hypothetical protein